MVLKVFGLSAIYLVFGLVTFLGIWKIWEEDIPGLYDKPRCVRISLRICSIVLWPAVFLLTCAGIIWYALRHLWGSLTE